MRSDAAARAIGARNAALEPQARAARGLAYRDTLGRVHLSDRLVSGLWWRVVLDNSGQKKGRSMRRSNAIIRPNLF